MQLMVKLDSGYQRRIRLLEDPSITERHKGTDIVDYLESPIDDSDTRRI